MNIEIEKMHRRLDVIEQAVKELSALHQAAREPVPIGGGWAYDSESVTPWIVTESGQTFALTLRQAIFAGILRQVRHARGLTIDQAAEEVGVSRTSYHRWELGYSAPGATHMAKCETWLRKEDNT